MLAKDTIFVVQNNIYSEEYRVVYAGRSAVRACEIAADYPWVRISVHSNKPTTKQQNEKGE
jgi:hypothetical protein